MENLKSKIRIRIETNEECIDNFSLSKEHQESIESENEFLKYILDNIGCDECHQDKGHSIDCSNNK